MQPLSTVCTHPLSSLPLAFPGAGHCRLPRVISFQSLARLQLGWDEVMQERCFSITSCYKTEGSVSEVVQYVYGNPSNSMSTRH